MDAQTEDDQWMQQAKNGDARAFGRIVARHQKRLTRFAARLLDNGETAQDAVQETFLRLWRVRHRYEPSGKLASLLLKITRNVCLDWSGRMPTEEWTDACETTKSGDPASILQTNARADAVRQAVQTLPEPMRTVFILSHYEAMPYAEIAALLGCPLGTVASRKRLAVEPCAANWRIGSKEKNKMTCDDAQPRLTTFLDGELNDDEKNDVRQHLAACTACSQTRDELAAVSRLADVWRVESASVQSAVLTQIALEEMASEMACLRAEVETLRAEIAALKRPNAAPLSVLLFPHAPPIAAPLHIV